MQHSCRTHRADLHEMLPLVGAVNHLQLVQLQVCDWIQDSRISALPTIMNHTSQVCQEEEEEGESFTSFYQPEPWTTLVTTPSWFV